MNLAGPRISQELQPCTVMECIPIMEWRLIMVGIPGITTPTLLEVMMLTLLGAMMGIPLGVGMALI